MSLTDIKFHADGLAPERNILTGSATASDTLNITNIANEQFINSSPTHTKSTTILNANKFKDIWEGHPAVDSNFGGHGAQFADIIEIAEPVYNAAKSVALNVGWNYFAYMLPYAQSAEDTMRTYYGRLDAEEFSGGPLAIFYGNNGTAATASFLQADITGPGREQSGTWGKSAYSPGAVWEFNIGGSSIRFILTEGSAYSYPLVDIGGVLAYTLPIPEYAVGLYTLGIFINRLFFALGNISISGTIPGIGLDYSYTYPPADAPNPGTSPGAIFTMQAKGSIHNTNTINVYIPQTGHIYHTDPTVNGIPAVPTSDTWQSSNACFSFNFGGGLDSSIKFGDYIPPYIADNTNNNAPWAHISIGQYSTGGTGIDQHFTLMKDNSGGAYIPTFGFNGIGNFTPGAAYQIKVNAPFTLKSWPLNRENLVRNISNTDLYRTRNNNAPIRFPLISDENKALSGNFVKYIKAMDAVTTDLPIGWFFIGWNRIHDTPGGVFDELNSCTFRSITSHGGGFAKEINHKPTSMSGTINVFNGSNQLIGTDVDFTSHYSVGDKIKYDIAGTKYSATARVVLPAFIDTYPAHTGPTGATEFFYKDQIVTSASIIDSVLLMKNNAGGVVMPEFNYDGIGVMYAGEGFQIKTSEAITGFAWRPHDNMITGLLSGSNDL